MKSAALVVLTLLAAATFVVVTGQELPPTVASHFDGSGRANAFMSRGGYLVFMVVLIVAVPGAIVALPRLLQRWAPGAINIPNRGYWLAPERRAASFEYLDGHLPILALWIAAFMCVVHWLVVEANRLQPARLDSGWLIAAMAWFAIVLAAWTLALYRRFRRPA